MVNKMFRGNLTADMLAIGVTVVLISEIDTNCRTFSVWIWYILSMPWYKIKYVMLQMENYQGDEIQKGIWEVLQLWCVVKSANLQSVSLCMFLSSESGKTYLFNSALIHFLWNQYAWYRKGIWWLGGVGARVWSLKEGKNMCHIYTYYLTCQRSVLTTWTWLQNAGSHCGAFCCVNGVSKCEETVG